MRQVITVNLNNNAFQVEDEGYAALRDYLDSAARTLADDPDSQEILRDLEQAIADKCNGFLGPHKTVVTREEIATILHEMGPVTPGSDAPGSTGDAGPSAGTGSGNPPRHHARRLYRLPEGKVFAGVCTGLAAYLGVDVVWVRVLWVLFTLFTGVWLLVYLAAVFLVPRADTATERAAAHGESFNARELVDSARQKYEQARRKVVEVRSELDESGRAWRQSARQWQRSFRHRMADGLPRPSPIARLIGAVLLPLFAILSAGLFVAIALALALVVTGGGAPSWGLASSGLPTWLPVLVLLLAYAVVALPLGAGHRMALYYANGGSRFGWADMWSGVIWLATAALLLWALHQALPEVRELIDQLLLQLRDDAASTVVTL